MDHQPKTAGDLAREINVPLWKIRRVVDSLGVPIPRVGQYRIITPEAEQRIRAELRRQAWPMAEREAVPC